jgi:hypothetical protein
MWRLPKLRRTVSCAKGNGATFMNTGVPNRTAFEILVAARKVANFASADGIKIDSRASRPTCDHLGAVLADSVLQAGLNYSSVVRPRVSRILSEYPQTKRIEALIEITKNGETGAFLNWTHVIKISRFERLVAAMNETGICDVRDLRLSFRDPNFESSLQNINGIGPKTVDYMACLVGIESIAVDRHIRTYAERAGIGEKDYYYLRRVFCFAADLLRVSRREFDSWIWKRESSRISPQLSFDLA